MKQMYIKLGLILLAGFGCITGHAQTLSGLLRGRVSSEFTQEAVKGASLICFVSPSDSLVTQTDEGGEFRLEAPVGRRKVLIRMAGYQDYSIPDLVISSGKQTVLDISLLPVVFQGKEVPIVANTFRDISPVSTRVFTVEESKRFAAAYFDPARVVTSYPGVAAANDQANHLVIRGNNPNGLSWRLEGVEIVNPNHLTNAGTFSDRISQSGGGTIILSTQLLDNSTFSTGAFSSQYGNALAGVFDIHLREGNNQKNEYTLQAGLIGIDLAAEGPISKAKGSSFLANYRYSTVGLLGAIGIEFGNEQITYQDLSFNLHLPTKRLGTFSLFGMGGLSITRYRGADSLETERDRFDTDFFSNMGALGATHQKILGNRTLWKSTLVFSGIESGRQGELISDTLSTPLTVENDEVVNARLSFRSGITHSFNAASTLEGGVYYTRIYNRSLSQIRELNTQAPLRELAAFEGGGDLIQPYLDWHVRLNPRLKAQLGLHGFYFGLNGSRSLEPRANLIWQASPKHQMKLAYGLHSQLQPTMLYFLSVPQEGGQPPIYPNRSLDLTRAHHLVGNYQFSFAKDWRFQVEAYGQYLFGVPITPGDTMFSTLNLFEAFVSDQIEGDSLVNLGEGRNYGIEFSLEKFLSQNYYLLFSGSLFEAEYRSGGETWLDSRYNGRFQFSATGGYEWARVSTKGKNKTWGINLRMLYRGGYWATPVDVTNSELRGRTIYAFDQGYTERLPDFFRIDLRVMFKRHRPKVTRTFGLDIQNVTNQQNVAFQTFDPVQGGLITRYQLGIIPLLSYRLEF